MRNNDKAAGGSAQVFRLILHCGLGYGIYPFLSEYTEVQTKKQVKIPLLSCLVTVVPGRERGFHGDIHLITKPTCRFDKFSKNK